MDLMVCMPSEHLDQPAQSQNTNRVSNTKPRLFKNCILKISPPKTESFQIKNSDIFHISAKKIDCGYSLEPPSRGGSNEYPQSMFLSRNKKNNVYPYKPQFYYIKVGFRVSKLYRYVFVLTWRSVESQGFTISSDGHRTL